MKKVDAKWAAKLLKEASSEFSDHGCNDMLVPATPENLEFIARCMKTGDDEYEPQIMNGKVYVNDSLAMSYLAELLGDQQGDIVFDDGETMTEDKLNEMLDQTHKSGIEDGKRTASKIVMDAAMRKFADGKTGEAEALRLLAVEINK
jgi:hypothetical protein